MRLSLDAQKAVYAQETGEYPVLLFTISHPTLTKDILISTDNKARIEALTTETEVVYGTISNGQEFIYCPMEAELPTEDEDTPPQMRLSIGNVGRELVEQIRAMVSSPTVTVRMVLASNPSQIEGEIEGLTFSDIEVNRMTVTGTLVMDIFTSEPFPHHTFTPSTSPGNFK